MTEARFHSDFGGLWTDRLDASDELVRRVSSGEVPAQLQEHLAKFIADGYVVLEGAVDPAACDRLRVEQADIFRYGSHEHLLQAAQHSHPSLVPENPPASAMRVVDLYGATPQALDVLLAEPVVSLLTVLFEEAPLLFQGLTFEHGSQQGFHQDTAYVVTDPPMALAAAWVALEDIHEGSGELRYLRGSHRLADWKFSGEHKHWSVVRDGVDEHTAWIDSLSSRAGEAGMVEERFLARKGDVLVWSADLAHGGSPVLHPELTRRSIVGHFCPVSATPHYFNFVPGRVKLPMRGAAISSMFYDFSGGYPAHRPRCVDGSAPVVYGTGEPPPPILPMISYAQHAEDVVLANYFGEQRRGFYVDVGANHPVDGSVTKHFYDLGWRGINVEPAAHLHELLQQRRPRDVNLMVDLGAAPAETLASICDEHVGAEIDFLRVGSAPDPAQVLGGHDWARFAPRVVLAASERSEQWHHLLVSKGYRCVLDDAPNRFYLRADLAPEGTQWQPAAGSRPEESPVPAARRVIGRVARSAPGEWLRRRLRR